VRIKNLGSANKWKGIPKELQDCMDKGHIGHKSYAGKKSKNFSGKSTGCSTG
jgi:hypothetical protein